MVNQIKFKRVRYLVFLKDVFTLSITAFGGPQAHLALFLDKMVKKRGYTNKEGLIELYGLCQLLPGPTSTQTITSLGFKLGGPRLAYLTLIVWVFPAVTIMTIGGLAINQLQKIGFSIDFLRFVQPMVIGIVAHSAYRISNSVVASRFGYFVMILSAFISCFVKNPFLFPFIILAGGCIAAFRYKRYPLQESPTFRINWTNFVLWVIVIVIASSLWKITGYLPFRLFDNFYRNGSMIFGGGQVLVPLLYTEFVEFKQYLTSEEFISGYAIVQSIPGPVFSFSAYIGTLSMNTEGLGNQILGGIFSAVGVFLPGTFFILLVVRFWDRLKSYRMVKASLEGINAVSAGMVYAAVFLLFQSIEATLLNCSLMIATTLFLLFTKIPTPFVIGIGIFLGTVIN